MVSIICKKPALPLDRINFFWLYCIRITLMVVVFFYIQAIYHLAKCLGTQCDLQWYCDCNDFDEDHDGDDAKDEPEGSLSSSETAPHWRQIRALHHGVSSGVRIAEGWGTTSKYEKSWMLELLDILSITSSHSIRKPEQEEQKQALSFSSILKITSTAHLSYFSFVPFCPSSHSFRNLWISVA